MLMKEYRQYRIVTPSPREADRQDGSTTGRTLNVLEVETHSRVEMRPKNLKPEDKKAHHQSIGQSYSKFD